MQVCAARIVRMRAVVGRRDNKHEARGVAGKTIVASVCYVQQPYSPRSYFFRGFVNSGLPTEHLP